MKNIELKKNDVLYQDIESKIDNIKCKKRLYLILYRITKIVVFLAGGCITVLTGYKLKTDFKFNFDNYILVISTSITLLAAIEGLFSFKDKGKNNDVILFDLRRLRDRICFDYARSLDFYEQNKEFYFQKYMEILNSQKTIIEESGGEGK